MPFCVDFRRLKASMIAYTYPVPRMEDCIDRLGDAEIFSELDALCGYWQVPIVADDRENTTSTSHMGTFRYSHMPFGLRNAPATLQRALDIILSVVHWKVGLVYSDDIIVFTQEPQSHRDHIDHILTLLGEAGVKLKLKKCFFFQNEVEYLGHLIRSGCLAVSQQVKETSAVRESLLRETTTQLKSSRGICNVYRSFVDK